MDSLRVSGVKEYGEVDWSAVAGQMHPLDWILERGLPVYCRVDRNLHFAVTSKFRPLQAERVIQPGLLAPPRTDLLFEGKDERLSLLRLDDASVEDLRATGTAKLRVFRLGGLAPCRTPPDNGSGWSSSELQEVDFEKCILVDRLRWEALLAQRTPEALRISFSDMSVTLAVYLDDLCFEIDDVTAGAALQPVGTWIDDPLTDIVGDPCPHLLWAYRGALAFQQRRDAAPSEVMEWLRNKPPKELFNRRLIRTAKNLVPYRYRRQKDLKRQVFVKLPLASEIERIPAIGLALKCALAASCGWRELHRDGGASHEALARMLLDLGFGNLAIQDLVQMISGHEMSPAEGDDLVERVMRRERIDAAKTTSASSKLEVSPASGDRRTAQPLAGMPPDSEEAGLEGSRASGPPRDKPVRYW